MGLQGCLADKKTPLPRTLQQGFAQGPKEVLGGGIFLWARYPCRALGHAVSQFTGLMQVRMRTLAPCVKWGLALRASSGVGCGWSALAEKEFFIYNLLDRIQFII